MWEAPKFSCWYWPILWLSKVWSAEPGCCSASKMREEMSFQYYSDLSLFRRHKDKSLTSRSMESSMEDRWGPSSYRPRPQWHSEKQWMTWGHAEQSPNCLGERRTVSKENIKRNETLTMMRSQQRTGSPLRSWKSNCFILLHSFSPGPWDYEITLVPNSRTNFFLTFSVCPNVMTG